VNSVVRVGDTVRRIPGNCTPTIHRLLAHVRERGVTWVPAPLGYDDRGREILTFIPGDVPHEMPEWVWSEVVLTDAARSLRQWHDATIGFDAAGSTWGLDARDLPEVICHSDFAPYNCVFRDGRLVGLIDFDFCTPGPRLWDIAYTAYRFAKRWPARPRRAAGRSIGTTVSACFARRPRHWAARISRRSWPRWGARSGPLGRPNTSLRQPPHSRPEPSQRPGVPPNHAGLQAARSKVWASSLRSPGPECALTV